MAAADPGHMPDNAVFHAEATVLLRAAVANGGALAGKSLDVRLTRPLCHSCEKVLPLAGLELGNPTVTFTDNNGVARTIRDGAWKDWADHGGLTKHAYFASRPIKGWPRPEEIEHYFLKPAEQAWFFETGNDTAGFDADGIDGTAHLEARQARSNVSLSLAAHPRLGVLLQWSKWDGQLNYLYYAKGHSGRMREFVRNMHDDPLPVGLLVPFDIAWNGVREFLETDGRLPKSIAWIWAGDLPPNTFPEPHDPVVAQWLVRD